MRRIQIGGSGNGYSVLVSQKRLKVKSAAIGMAKQGYHDMNIRQTLGLSPALFKRLKANISQGIWAKGGWW